jgi:hypothetical protein
MLTISKLAAVGLINMRRDSVLLDQKIGTHFLALYAQNLLLNHLNTITENYSFLMQELSSTMAIGKLKYFYQGFVCQP